MGSGRPGYRQGRVSFSTRKLGPAIIFEVDGESFLSVFSAGKHRSRDAIREEAIVRWDDLQKIAIEAYAAGEVEPVRHKFIDPSVRFFAIPYRAFRDVAARLGFCEPARP